MRIKPIFPGTQQNLSSVEQKIIESRGRVPPLYQVLLNSPEMALGWEKLLTAVRQKNSLPGTLRELIILRVAVLNGANYEFEAHKPIALELGVPESKINGLRHTKLPEGYDRTEQLVLGATDSLTRDLTITDELYGSLEKTLTTQQILDLMITIGAYNMVSRVLTALKIGH